MRKMRQEAQYILYILTKDGKKVGDQILTPNNLSFIEIRTKTVLTFKPDFEQFMRAVQELSE